MVLILFMVAHSTSEAIESTTIVIIQAQNASGAKSLTQ
jgi:hypothetical protein